MPCFKDLNWMLIERKSQTPAETAHPQEWSLRPLIKRENSIPQNSNYQNPSAFELLVRFLYVPPCPFTDCGHAASRTEIKCCNIMNTRQSRSYTFKRKAKNILLNELTCITVKRTMFYSKMPFSTYIQIWHFFFYKRNKPNLKLEILQNN